MTETNDNDNDKKDEVEVTFPMSPVVVGDMVSIRKWINTKLERNRKGPAAGRVVRVWRSHSSAGIMVRVRLGFLNYVELSSSWVKVI
jgi:hypothetical protein